MCTRAAHPSCFYTAVSVPLSRKALEREGGFGGGEEAAGSGVKMWRGKDKKEPDKVTASGGGGLHRVPQA